MKKLISIILSVLFIAGSSFAEIVNEIQISGNKRVSDETVKVYGEIKPEGSDFSNSDINNILKNLYSTNFFEDVNIEIRNKKLIINLIEYPVINEIVLIGEQNTRVKNQIKKIISSKEKNSFIKNNLNKDINLIKKLYSSLGYKFSQVETKVRNIDKNNVDLAINIDKGEITRISKIFFTGDKKIKDKRLRDIIASEEDKFWKVISRNTRFNENQIALDKRLLINYYKNLGYYDVKVTSSSAEIQDSENINLYYSIEAGKRYIFAKIDTALDTTFDKEIFFPLRENYNDLIGSITKKNTFYQWRRVYVRENKSGVCPTLTANMGTGGHNVPLIKDDYGIRKITPRECFNLQGFPRNFKLPRDVPNTQLYKQAGNSVTVDIFRKFSSNSSNVSNKLILFFKLMASSNPADKT